MHGHMRSVSRGRPPVSHAVGPDGSPVITSLREREMEGPDREGASRLADYLSASFHAAPRPLRHERRIQRNKAIVMVLFAALVLFWLAHRLLL